MITLSRNIVPRLKVGLFVLLLVFSNESALAKVTISYLSIGDSIMAGFGNPAGTNPVAYSAVDLTASGYTAVFGNAAVGGSKASDWQPGMTNFTNAMALAASMTTHPSIAVIMLGVNDAKPFNYNDVGKYIGNMKNIVNQLVKNGYKVILTDCMYIANGDHMGLLSWDDGAGKLIVEYNTALAGLDNGDTVRYFGGLYAWARNNQSTTTFPDGVHPNAAGDSVIGKFMAKAISAVIDGAPGGKPNTGLDKDGR